MFDTLLHNTTVAWKAEDSNPALSLHRLSLSKHAHTSKKRPNCRWAQGRVRVGMSHVQCMNQASSEEDQVR